MSHINDQIDIPNLIAEAVTNAKARRNQVLDSKITLFSLSDNESEKIAGGKDSKDGCSRKTTGMFIKDNGQEILIEGTSTNTEQIFLAE